MPEPSPHQSVRVVVWHRHRLLREGMVLALIGRSVVDHAVAAPRAELLDELCASEHAGTCIVDLNDPSVEQWDALGRLRTIPGVRVVGIHRSLDPATARRALDVGVRSVVGMNEGLDGVISALRPAGWRSASFGAPGTPTPLLNERELAVLRLVSLGLTARAIAERLGLTLSQVDGCKQGAFHKLGVQHQSEAIAAALRHGLLVDAEL